MPTLTVFTATYNRGHLIGKLYQSLLRQENFDFEWLVVDDGSADNTPQLFEQWLKNDNPFPIRYYRQENAGLIRALNRGISLAEGRYLSKIDSDDYVTDDFARNMLSWIPRIDGEKDVYAVSGLRVTPDGTPLLGVWPDIPKDGYVDATDLERAKYRLNADMCEAWSLEVLRRYPFPVWPTEKFAPEQIVLHQIALDGYKLRWYPVPMSVCEYQQGGLTLGAHKLERENPMGFAMAYNHMLKRPDISLAGKLKCAMNFVALCIVGHNPGYIRESNRKLLAVLMFLPGAALSVRRARQYRS